ncbi:hypothetical protein AC739_09620 [Planococcus glaciei]|uniref:sugar-binding transcriptional regulator n=1 Tax=Planococcus glaciei TaxID=459472 RepID=UPI00069F398A|nr:sugar-binding transcriptional regulator [Planococcus glaciei]KOF10590.1 hypothetical protein AC739_09620 [Planococcus glaciei]
MLNDKDLLSIEVARMYYEFDKTQQEIAETFSISRPTVSKLLKYAKEKKYIQITIESPVDAINSLEESLKEKYGLREVKIAYANPLQGSDANERNMLGKKVAAYLENIVQDKDRIGISWGETLYHVSQEIQPKAVQGVEIVQLKGGMNLVQADTHDQEIMTQFVKKYNAKGQYIPLPVVFETEYAKNTLLKEKQTQKILEKINEVNIALYTIGTVTKDSLLYRMHYIADDEFAYLEEHAVCDICSRFIDEKGGICLEDLNSRTFGIDLEQLSKVENSILIAGGDSKIKGIHTALINCIPNVLITDSMTALKLIEY